MTQKERIMKILKCSEAEADEVLQADKAIDRGERMPFDLDPEVEKQAKKFANTGTRKVTKVQRKTAEKPVKQEIIAKVASFLAQMGYEMVEITNPTRQIHFQSDGIDYEFTLIEKRKPKK